MKFENVSKLARKGFVSQHLGKGHLIAAQGLCLTNGDVTSCGFPMMEFFKSACTRKRSVAPSENTTAV